MTRHTAGEDLKCMERISSLIAGASSLVKSFKCIYCAKIIPQEKKKNLD